MRLKRFTTAIMMLLMSLSAHSQLDGEPEILPEIPDSGGDRLEGDLSNQNSNNNNVTKTYNGAGSNGMPVNTAVSPSLMVTGSESCLKSISGGVQFVGVGVSSGKYVQDEFCNMRRFAITLSQLGMKVASISLLCQNESVYRALLVSGAPCPVLKYGRLVVGRSAYLEIRSNPALHIPDYKEDRDFYDTILGVGETGLDEENDTGSLSDRFRTNKRERDTESN